jgi:MoxR-like ATPase
VKFCKLFRVRAWLLSGGAVSRDDLRLLACLGGSLQEIEHLREKAPASWAMREIGERQRTGL